MNNSIKVNEREPMTVHGGLEASPRETCERVGSTRLKARSLITLKERSL